MKLFGWHPRTTSSRRKASFHARHGSFLVFSILFSPRADSPLSAEVTEITSPCQTATTSSTQHKHRNKMDETNFVCEGTERADERGELGALKTRRLCDGRSDFQATFQYPIGLLDWGDRNQKLAGTLHNVCRWKPKREVESSHEIEMTHRKRHQQGQREDAILSFLSDRLYYDKTKMCFLLLLWEKTVQQKLHNKCDMMTM